MKKIVDYYLALESAAQTLESRVRELIVEDGLQPIGGFSSSHKGFPCQVMVKYEEGEQYEFGWKDERLDRPPVGKGGTAKANVERMLERQEDERKDFMEKARKDFIKPEHFGVVEDTPATTPISKLLALQDKFKQRYKSIGHHGSNKSSKMVKRCYLELSKVIQEIENNED